MGEKITLRLSTQGIKPIQAIARTDPEITIAREGQIRDLRVAEGIQVVGPGTEILEPIAVVSTQAVLGAEPQKPLTILQHAGDR